MSLHEHKEQIEELPEKNKKRKYIPTSNGTESDCEEDERNRGVPQKEYAHKIFRKWTEDEDERLRQGIAKFGEVKWREIAAIVGTRDHYQCLQRWSKILKPGLKKGNWEEEEDALLVYLVSKGFDNWGKLAVEMPGRTSKQCRERWCHHLDPSVVKSNFTPEEDSIILKKHAEYGNKWARIAKLLPGRNDNNVKMRYYSLERSLKNGLKPTESSHRGPVRHTLSFINSMPSSKSIQTSLLLSLPSSPSPSSLSSLPCYNSCSAPQKTSTSQTQIKSNLENLQHIHSLHITSSTCSPSQTSVSKSIFDSDLYPISSLLSLKLLNNDISSPSPSSSASSLSSLSPSWSSLSSLSLSLSSPAATTFHPYSNFSSQNISDLSPTPSKSLGPFGTSQPCFSVAKHGSTQQYQPTQHQSNLGSLITTRYLLSMYHQQKHISGKSFPIHEKIPTFV